MLRARVPEVHRHTGRARVVRRPGWLRQLGHLACHEGCGFDAEAEQRRPLPRRARQRAPGRGPAGEGLQGLRGRQADTGEEGQARPAGRRGHQRELRDHSGRSERADRGLRTSARSRPDGRALRAGSERPARGRRERVRRQRRGRAVHRLRRREGTVQEPRRRPAQVSPAHPQLEPVRRGLPGDLGAGREARAIRRWRTSRRR